MSCSQALASAFHEGVGCGRVGRGRAGWVASGDGGVAGGGGAGLLAGRGDQVGD
jgi:hypothetical protein